MPKPLKVRRADEIAGLFVLLALAIALSGLLLGPGTRHWFTPSRTLAIHLPPEGSLGLREGGDVQILGSVVGSVEKISVTDAGEMEARVNIRGNFIRFVRSDSRAIIRRPLGIGDASIEITRGHGEPLPPDAVLESLADKGPTEFMEETLVALREEALPALRELRAAVAEYKALAAELRSQEGPAQQALARLARIGAALEKGEGLAGMLLTDPKPAAELKAALPRLGASLDELQATLRGARQLSDRLPKIADDVAASAGDVRASTADARRLAAALPELERSVRRSADALPGVLLQTQETLHQIERLTEGLQRNRFIRGSMAPDEGGGGRIDSDRVGTDR